MVRRRDLLAAAATFGVAAPALAACGGGDDGDGTVTLNLTWWGDDDRSQRYQQAVELFQTANPTIKVTTAFATWDDYWTQRTTEAAAASLPDVMQFDLSYLAEYGGRNQLLDLGPYLGNGIDTSTMDASVLPAGEYNGTTCGIVSGTNAFTLAYDPVTLQALGVDAPPADLTWDAYNTWITEVATAGASKDPVVYGSGNYTGTLWIFIHYLRQQGIEPFEVDGTVNFTEDQLAGWWDSVAAQRTKGFIPAKRVDALSPSNAMWVGEIVSESFWDNQLSGYVTGAGVDADRYVLLPMPTQGGDSGLFYKASMLLAAGANTEHPEEAAKLIDFLTNDAEVGTIFGTSRGVPASSTQRDAIVAEGVDAVVMAYEEAVADSVGDTQGPLPQGFGTVETEFKRLGTEIDYGTTTAAQAAADWFAYATDALGS